MQVPQAQDSTTEPGCGVKATVEGQAVAVGRLDWVQHQARINSNSAASSSTDSSMHSSSSRSSSSSDSAERERSDDSELASSLTGQSVVYVGLEGRGVIGALGFSDTLRADSQYVVQQLHSRGIRVVVLSGIACMPCFHCYTVSLPSACSLLDLAVLPIVVTVPCMYGTSLACCCDSV